MGFAKSPCFPRPLSLGADAAHVGIHARQICVSAVYIYTDIRSVESVLVVASPSVGHVAHGYVDSMSSCQSRSRKHNNTDTRPHQVAGPNSF